MSIPTMASAAAARLIVLLPAISTTPPTGPVTTLTIDPSANIL